MNESEQFFRALGLRSINRQNVTPSCRPLTIQVNLRAHQHTKELVPWTPKTPCSMLSPLTPKLHNRQFDWYNAFYDEDSEINETPKKPGVNDTKYIETDDTASSLLKIDLASPLGQRLSQVLAMLLNTHFNLVTEYDKYCNSEPPVEDIRARRSLLGKVTCVYKRRYRHQYTDRPYMFSVVDKRERKQQIYCGGLNKRSRVLHKSMRKCSVVLKKLDTKYFTTVDGVKSINSGLIIYSPYVKLVPLHSSVLPKSYAKSLSKNVTAGNMNENTNQVSLATQSHSDDCNLTAPSSSVSYKNDCPSVDIAGSQSDNILKPISPNEPGNVRKSARRRGTPRRLLHNM